MAQMLTGSRTESVASEVEAGIAGCGCGSGRRWVVLGAPVSLLASGSGEITRQMEACSRSAVACAPIVETSKAGRTSISSLPVPLHTFLYKKTIHNRGKEVSILKEHIATAIQALTQSLFIIARDLVHRLIRFYLRYLNRFEK